MNRINVCCILVSSFIFNLIKKVAILPILSILFEILFE